MSQSGQPASRKKRRVQPQRIAVDFEGPSGPGGVPSFDHVSYRLERLQPSTGMRYQSKRTLVVDTLWLPPEDSNVGLDPDSSMNNTTIDGPAIGGQQEEPEPISKKRKKKQKSLASRRPMVLWKEGFRDMYLDELLRWEGRGDAWHQIETPCADCLGRKVVTPPAGIYRCSDCFYPHMLCKECCVRRHRMLPLHVIQEWTGSTFIKTSLKKLGFRIQLNHLSLKCSQPEAGHAKLVILHTNGLHEVSLDFCGCQPVSKVRQLMRRGLFPSSQDNPRTCATFDLLRHLHMLSLTSKCSTYDYYRALEKLTNNSGVDLPASKYRPLMRMALQWRHLKMMKRAGRGHDDTGVAGTKEGELAIACPSCPHPGINIPEGWEKAGDDERFLYFVVLCIDANFRLKNQLVSNYSSDPGLGTGLSYTIKRKPYEEYVRSRGNDVNIDESRPKGCGLQAVDQANTKYSKGLRYTGVSGVSCGRSEMLLPCSVGNLQKGEKYCCMDYACGSAMRFIYVLLIILIYDIACQWFVNLANRIQNHWPEEIKPRAGVTLVPVIPKLHEKGHTQSKKHEQFSCNLCRGIGHTDGECPERIWSAHNAVGSATKTMGPGSRHDVLDDHFGYWNYEKYISIGKTLMRRYQKALPERNRQAEAHRGFSESINPSDVAQWTKLCEDWENAAFPREKFESPYHVVGTDLTQAQVRKELAEEEDKTVAGGGAVYHKTSASQFLSNGLAIEDSQRRLSWVVRQKEKEATAIAEERGALRKEIEKWRRIQAIYMPGLLQHLSDLERANPGSTEDGDKAEEMRLWLPSSIPKADRENVCIPQLAMAEERLRTAQCLNSLSSIRATLRLKSRMVQFKNKNIRGQRSGTRSRELINRVHNRARKYAARYRAARAAKLALSGPGSWETTLQPLQDSDVRSYQDPERLKPRTRRKGTYEDGDHPEEIRVDESEVDGDQGGICEDDGEGIDLLPESRGRREGSGQTRLKLSWIWTVVSYDPDSPEAKDNSLLRAEWARSRARVDRAREEVKLLREEMRRVLVYLEWKANWWKSKECARHVEDIVLAEGLRSYCVDQATRQLALRESFQELWKTPLDIVLPADGALKSASKGVTKGTSGAAMKGATKGATKGAYPGPDEEESDEDSDEGSSGDSDTDDD
ncbi:hypothetical protein CVT26_008495 [Gymnopilus dilepis]|uniref:CxC2-like cysteine cluster KDZ transposase-associated domain-containing protein n=1 Tax=Gymnopilus dilepis TaxID=231916 RepID=A0A409YRW3_9AGAR|nr:hypothetical protein CVT26_008495 [Gymnopilus dilepis]